MENLTMIFIGMFIEAKNFKTEAKVLWMANGYPSLPKECLRRRMLKIPSLIGLASLCRMKIKFNNTLT